MPNYKRDHDYFWLEVDGKKSLQTKISYPESGEIPDGLLGAMKRQMCFASKKDFNRYFDCDMKKEEYIENLKTRKIIS